MFAQLQAWTRLSVQSLCWSELRTASYQMAAQVFCTPHSDLRFSDLRTSIIGVVTYMHDQASAKTCAWTSPKGVVDISQGCLPFTSVSCYPSTPFSSSPSSLICSSWLADYPSVCLSSSAPSGSESACARCLFGVSVCQVVGPEIARRLSLPTVLQVRRFCLLRQPRGSRTACFV